MAKSSVPVESSKHRLRNIIVGVFIFLLLLAAYFLWAFLPGSTQKLVSVGDQFKPSPSWKFVSETLTPPYNVCIDAQCGKLRKVWDLDEELKTTEQFQEVAKLDSKKLNVSGCTISSASEGSLKLCNASAKVDDYMVTIEYTKYKDDNPDITLNIEAKE